VSPLSAKLGNSSGASWLVELYGKLDEDEDELEEARTSLSMLDPMPGSVCHGVGTSIV